MIKPILIPVQIADIDGLLSDVHMYRDKLSDFSIENKIPMDLDVAAQSIFKPLLQRQRRKFTEDYLYAALDAAIAVKGYALVNGRKLNHAEGYGKMLYRAPDGSTVEGVASGYKAFMPELWEIERDLIEPVWYLNVDDPTVAMMLKLRLS